MIAGISSNRAQKFSFAFGIVFLVSSISLWLKWFPYFNWWPFVDPILPSWLWFLLSIISPIAGIASVTLLHLLSRPTNAINIERILFFASLIPLATEASLSFYKEFVFEPTTTRDAYGGVLVTTEDNISGNVNLVRAWTTLAIPFLLLRLSKKYLDWHKKTVLFLVGFYFVGIIYELIFYTFPMGVPMYFTICFSFPMLSFPVAVSVMTYAAKMNGDQLS